MCTKYDTLGVTESGKRNPKRKAEDREDRPTRKKMKKTETQVKADSQRGQN